MAVGIFLAQCFICSSPSPMSTGNLLLSAASFQSQLSLFLMLNPRPKSKNSSPSLYYTFTSLPCLASLTKITSLCPFQHCYNYQLFQASGFRREHWWFPLHSLTPPCYYQSTSLKLDFPFFIQLHLPHFHFSFSSQIEAKWVTLSRVKSKLQCFSTQKMSQFVRNTLFQLNKFIFILLKRCYGLKIGQRQIP